MNLLELLTKTLGDGEAVTLHLTRDNDRLHLAITPLLKTQGGDEDDDENEAGAAAKCRAALAMPFVISGSAEEIEADLAQHFTHYVAAREQTRHAMSAMLAAFSEAESAAKAATSAKKGSKAAAPALPGPAKPAVMSNPDSL